MGYLHTRNTVCRLLSGYRPVMLVIYTHGTLCVVCRLLSGYRPVMWVIYTHGTLYVDCCQTTGQ